MENIISKQWFKNNWQYVGAGLSAVLTITRSVLEGADAIGWATVLKGEWWTVIGLALVFLFGAAILRKYHTEAVGAISEKVKEGSSLKDNAASDFSTSSLSQHVKMIYADWVSNAEYDDIKTTFGLLMEHAPDKTTEFFASHHVFLVLAYFLKVPKDEMWDAAHVQLGESKLELLLLMHRGNLHLNLFGVKQVPSYDKPKVIIRRRRYKLLQSTASPIEEIGDFPVDVSSL